MRKKVTVFIFVLILVFSCITTVAMAIIPTGVGGFFEKPYEIYICSYQTADIVSTHKSRIVNNEEQQFSTIFNMFEEASVQKMLSVVCQGKSLDRIEQKYTGREPRFVNKNLGDQTKKTIVFHYYTPKKFELNNKQVCYSYLFFEISDSNKVSACNIGISTEENFDISSNKFYYNYYYQAEFNFYNLFNELEKFL